MSKSLGNVVDPLDVARDYGADALRFTMATGGGGAGGGGWVCVGGGVQVCECGGGAKRGGAGFRGRTTHSAGRRANAPLPPAAPARHRARAGPEPVAGPREQRAQLHQQDVERGEVHPVQPGGGAGGGVGAGGGRPSWCTWGGAGGGGGSCMGGGEGGGPRAGGGRVPRGKLAPARAPRTGPQAGPPQKRAAAAAARPRRPHTFAPPPGRRRHVGAAGGRGLPQPGRAGVAAAGGALARVVAAHARGPRDGGVRGQRVFGGGAGAGGGARGGGARARAGGAGGAGGGRRGRGGGRARQPPTLLHQLD